MAGSDSNGYVGYYAKEVHTGDSKVINKDGYLFYTYNGINYLLRYVGDDTDLILPDSYNGEDYEIYEYAFALLGAIGFAGVVMFISATVKNNVLALLFSLACVYGPMMIAEYLPYELQKVLDLLPLVGSGADIFRTNTFHIFGKYVWSPYLLVTVPVMIGICCMPFAIRNWSRRLKA